MSMRHSTTKRKRRPKSSKRVDWTAETLRKLKELEECERVRTAVKQRENKIIIPADDLDIYGTENTNGN